MDISIFGLGYVGAVSCACMSRNGNTVIGVDISRHKVDLINAGKSPIIEKDLEERLGESVANGTLSATTDVADAIARTSVSIICVGTPSQNTGAMDLTFVYKVCEEIGNQLRNKDEYHSVVIRSTLVPGTMKECAAIIEEASGKACGEGFGLAVNPEFLREGSAIADYYAPPYTVVGSDDARCIEAVKEIYAELDAPVFQLLPEEAEMIKYANNNFHALKITFANEIGNICKELGVDGQKVMDVVAKDKKLNLSSYYMKPGFAFGGSCLPKDVRGLGYKAKTLDVNSPVLNSILDSNEEQIRRGLELIRAAGSKKVGFLGFAFKAGTDDLRESPLLEVMETLIGKGFEVSAYDANVNLSKLLGKNKKFVMEHIPHISAIMKDTIEEVMDAADVLVIGNGAEEFRDIPSRASASQTIIDLVRIDPHKVTSGNYVGICW